MAIDKNKLASIIEGKARAMCSPQYDRMLDAVSSSKRQGIQTPNYNDYGFDDPLLSESYTPQNTQYSNTQNTGDFTFTNENVQNSRLPEFIKESMATQSIDMSNAGNLSVLDTMGIKGQKPQTQQRQMVTENVVNHTNINSGIDYSIIKAIINECLKEYFDNKQTLNESTSLQTIGLQNGNISLVDNKGNIYKAKLEKIGNKNDKK